jgi:hypothetical protein
MSSGDDHTNDDEDTMPPLSLSLTIAEAARAIGSSRPEIRRRLHGGEFPNAFKDTQGFWRSPEADLRAAGLPTSDGAAVAPSAVSPSDIDGEIEQLKLENLRLHIDLEKTEALLVAERRLSVELGETLKAERRTLAALLGQDLEPERRADSALKPNWQSGLRAARARELERRAERARQGHP